MRVRCLAVLLVCVQAVLASHSPASSSLSVPFKFYRGYQIVVKGSIGELEDLNFLIDTGAYPTVLNLRLAHKLGLATRSGSLRAQDASVPANQALIPHLDVGPVCARSQPVIVRDLYFIQQKTGLQVDVMLGVDVLGDYNFSIDFRSRRINFSPHEL